MKKSISSSLIQCIFLLALMCLPLKGFSQTRQFYWENPRQISQVDSYFPVVVSRDQTHLLFFEEVEKSKKNGKIWISLKKYDEESSSWSSSRRIAGPFSYSGEIPDIYSAAISPSGTVALAVLTSPSSIGVFTSLDGGESFEEVSLEKQKQSVVGPRIYSSSDGGFVLFTSQGRREVVSNADNSNYERFAFALLSASSSDGKKWTNLSPFEGSKNLSNPFVPYLAAVPGGDLVVFQAQYEFGEQSRLSNQLYASFRPAGTSTWTEPVLVTGPESLSLSSEYSFERYHNQRPVLFTTPESIYLAWERTAYSSDTASIWCAQITPTGTISFRAEQLSTAGKAHRPQLFTYDQNVYALWFDDRRANDSVYLARSNGYIWDESTLVAPEGNTSATFAYPLVSKNGTELSFVWLQTTKEKNRIYTLESDRTVLPPEISPTSYKENKRSTAKKARAKVSLPSDSSGIAGFSWIWTRNPDEEPPELLTNLSDDTSISALAEEDGLWYFKVKATDYAGNWSKSTTLSYYRDTTPPEPPVITPPQLDGNGFLTANTFTMNWVPAESDDDVASYSWALENIAPIDPSLNDTARHPTKLSASEMEEQRLLLSEKYASKLASPALPPRRSQGTNPSVRYTNRVNGLYTFSVCAIDTVGNIGKPSYVTLYLNKYAPFTQIVSVYPKIDLLGSVSVSILGRGFTYDGTIDTVYIDRDGIAPYDITLKRSAGDFKVINDESIRGITLTDVEEGKYKIGLVHTDRGLYFTKNILTISELGTVKVETQYEFQPDWQPVTQEFKYHIETGAILLWVLFALAVFGLFTSIAGLAQTGREAVLIKQEVHALLTGAVMPQEKKEKAQALERKGVSLKVKLLAFTVQIVLVVVLFVSIPLGFLMTKTQEQTLAQGLEDRVSVLFDSLTSSVRAYLPSQNDLEITSLPAQTQSFEEASYATILALPRNGENTNIDYIWATNDPHITDKIDSDSYLQGSTRITDPQVSEIIQRLSALNEEAVSQVGEMTTNISELNARAVSLALKTDKDSVEKRNQINESVRTLTEQINASLTDLSRSGSGSFPDFNTEQLDRSNTTYLFYRPVLYRQGGEQNYVRSIILLEVSTENLIKSVSAARNTIFITTAIIAFVAIGIGIIGSLILASIIIKPIRRLVSHVEKISETKDKSRLAGQELAITTRDEIGLLGETVNEMTRSLVRAAQDENLLMDGKVVQQAFLPLGTDGAGNKQTTAILNDNAVQFFGYYEGASGVSGDYFDYKKLDDRWYVIIKCDASGHGVPAALIMTVVATFFRRYFEDWTFKTHGTDLTKLVTQINDFIESLGLKGKFATLMICLADTKSGDVYLCNAGDNIIHYYDVSEQKEHLVTLTQTPAAGPLPSFMVEMKGGFKVEKLHLDKDDVLFLYTDGIEEATRKFRDSNFKVIQCAQGEEGAEHGNHKVGEESEQMNPDRIQEIIECVYAKKSYRLEKFHNPLGQEELIFDFTELEGSVEDSIMALAAVEKVFRMYKDPSCTAMDTVRVDRKIDDFLKKHFNRYDYYCSNQEDTGDVNYLNYTFLKEDEQLDDLTLLAMKKL